MPPLKEHVKLSKKRTGKGYIELNKWVDGKEVDFLTKVDRHVRVSKHSKYVKERWGKKGLEEYRNHLKDDLKRFFPMFARIQLIKQRKGIEKS